MLPRKLIVNGCLYVRCAVAHKQPLITVYLRSGPEKGKAVEVREDTLRKHPELYSRKPLVAPTLFEPKHQLAVDVGITSYRPGRTPEQVRQEGAAFEQRLKQLGIAGVSLGEGWGAWINNGQIEQEPTWVLHYRGDGKALQQIIAEANKHDQMAVVVWRRAASDDPQVATYHRLDFERELTPEEVSKLNHAAKEIELGGWTIDPHRGYFTTGAIPQWGDAEEHYNKVMKLADKLKGAGHTFRHQCDYVRVRVISKEHGYALGSEH